MEKEYQEKIGRTTSRAYTGFRVNFITHGALSRIRKSLSIGDKFYPRLKVTLDVPLKSLTRQKDPNDSE